MAEIEIQKKKGSIWVWLIPLLIVLALLWWLFARGDDDADELTGVAVPGAVVAPVEPADAPIRDAGDDAAITDVATVADTPDRRSLVGRRIQLTSVPVQMVSGDETFWVGTESERLFVTLATADMSESATNVNPGQEVTVAGVLREVPADPEELRGEWGLDDATITMLMEEGIYLAADRVAIAQPR